MGKNFKATSKLTAKFLIALLVVQAALFAFTAFGATSGSATIKKGTADAGSNIAAFVSATAGIPITLTGVLDAGATSATEKANTWTSSAPAVATATYATTGATVTITPLLAGLGQTTTITLLNKLSGKTDTVDVTVYRKLTAFTLTATTLKIQKGQSAQIKIATITPNDATVSSTTYTSSTTKVLANTTDGLNTVAGAVYGAVVGTSVVTVKSFLPDGTFLTKTVSVTVTEPVQTVVIKKGIATPTALGIDATKTISLTGTVTPTGATYKTLKWTSSNEAYATVSATGAVYGKIAGIGQTVTITATALDTLNSAADSVTFTVYRPMKSAVLSKSTLNMKIGGTKDVSAFTVITPADASIDPTTYSSSAISVATVDANGVVTAVGGGKATITVNINRHDGTKQFKINVIVSTASTSITLRPSTLTLKQFESKALSVTFAPTTVTYKKIDYTTSDASVAFVNPRTGVVTAVAPGIATITATPSNGGTVGKTDVTVTAIVED
jgi:uncharacterized protein YjdB